MKSGQFYRGKINGIQKHFESPDIDKLLPTDKLCFLYNTYCRFSFAWHAIPYRDFLLRAEIPDIIAPCQDSIS